jgi:hypothetical protein
MASMAGVSDPSFTACLTLRVMTVILTDMTVTQRKFLREFPAIRRSALAGEKITITSREGVTFQFTCSTPKRPRKSAIPAPPGATEDFSASGFEPGDWEITR